MLVIESPIWAWIVVLLAGVGFGALLESVATLVTRLCAAARTKGQE
jgi:hypothetical protein